VTLEVFRYEPGCCRLTDGNRPLSDLALLQRPPGCRLFLHSARKQRVLEASSHEVLRPFNARGMLNRHNESVPPVSPPSSTFLRPSRGLSSACPAALFHAAGALGVLPFRVFPSSLAPPSSSPGSSLPDALTRLPPRCASTEVVGGAAPAGCALKGFRSAKSPCPRTGVLHPIRGRYPPGLVVAGVTSPVSPPFPCRFGPDSRDPRQKRTSDTAHAFRIASRSLPRAVLPFEGLTISGGWMSRWPSQALATHPPLVGFLT